MTQQLSSILVIDSDPESRSFIATALSVHGYYAVEMPEVKSLDEIDLTRCVAIVTDLHSGNGNGLELVRAVKSNPDTAHILVVVCSSDADNGSVIEAFDAGADDYIAKPVAPKIFLAKINALMRRRGIK